MKLASRLAACLVFALLTNLLVAGDAAAAKKQGKKAKKAAATPAAFKLPDTISLSAEQQTKLDALKTQYSAKLLEAQQKVNAVLTPEQRTAQMAARKTAKAAGKKGKDMKAAVDASVQLSDEQKQKKAEADKELAKLNGEVRQQVVGLLTPEQKQQIKGKGKGKKAA